MKSGGMPVRYEEEKVSAEQRQRLEQIQETKKDQDTTLAEIGDLVDVLNEKAGKMGDEIKVQSAMLTELSTELEAVHEHQQAVNESLGETLKAVRANDKICMDIACVLLSLLIVGVWVKYTQNQGG